MTKLTEKQRGVLKKMADGWTLVWMSASRQCDPHAFMYRNGGEHERVRVDYISKFFKAGLIERCSDPRYYWRNVDYRITSAGQEEAG